MQSPFQEVPTLLTPRLKLRPFALSDAKEVQRMAGSVNVARTTATIPHPYLDGLAEQWIASHAEAVRQKNWSLVWAIQDLQKGHLLGCISFICHGAHRRAEMGYWIGEEHWNRGICSEAVQAGIGYFFKNTDLNKITSRHLSINPSSGRVMQKAGMSPEGLLRQDMFRNGEFQDMVVYGLLKSEFQGA